MFFGLESRGLKGYLRQACSGSELVLRGPRTARFLRVSGTGLQEAQVIRTALSPTDWCSDRAVTRCAVVGGGRVVDVGVSVDVEPPCGMPGLERLPLTSVSVGHGDLHPTTAGARSQPTRVA